MNNVPIQNITELPEVKIMRRAKNIPNMDKLALFLKKSYGFLPEVVVREFGNHMKETKPSKYIIGSDSDVSLTDLKNTGYESGNRNARETYKLVAKMNNNLELVHLPAHINSIIKKYFSPNDVADWLANQGRSWLVKDDIKEEYPSAPRSGGSKKKKSTGIAEKIPNEACATIAVMAISYNKRFPHSLLTMRILQADFICRQEKLCNLHTRRLQDVGCNLSHMVQMEESYEKNGLITYTDYIQSPPPRINILGQDPFEPSSQQAMFKDNNALNNTTSSLTALLTHNNATTSLNTHNNMISSRTDPNNTASARTSLLPSNIGTNTNSSRTVRPSNEFPLNDHNTDGDGDVMMGGET